MTDKITESAQTLAEYNPSHAIAGWLAGFEAYGDTDSASVCRAALEIQASWQSIREIELLGA